MLRGKCHPVIKMESLNSCLVCTLLAEKVRKRGSFSIKQMLIVNLTLVVKKNACKFVRAAVFVRVDKYRQGPKKQIISDMVCSILKIYI